MIETSALYKQYVYTKDTARYFLPEAVIKIIDITAMENAEYQFFDLQPFSKPQQLTDEVISTFTNYASCELNHTVLNGKHTLLPEVSPAHHQIGIISTQMSNSSCMYDPPIELTCEYTYPIDAAGRTIFFNDVNISYPVDFDITFFDADDEILSLHEIRNNNSYVYVLVDGNMGVKKVKYTFYKSNVPFAFIKIIEDIHGLFINYRGEEIISLSYNAAVDIFSREILTGEIDLDVRNDGRELSIFNDSGLEAYLQRRQEIDFFLNLIFPDDTYERVQIGRTNIVEWDGNSTSLMSSFVTRDALDKLRGDYNKGQHYEIAISLYDIAIDIFNEANFTNYEIDPELQNIYTHGVIPRVSCKEALRLVAQAGRSVVLTDVFGKVKIKFIGIPTGWYEKQDTLTADVLFEYPMVRLREPVKRVVTNIYTYTKADEITAVHTSTRSIGGTEDIEILLSDPAIECVLSLSTGTIEEVTYYPNIIYTTITVGTEEEPVEVTITVNGKTLTSSRTSYIKDNQLSQNLTVDAVDEKIDNPLLSTTEIAKDVTDYVTYWLTRRHRYEFMWRQNPAIELTDKVQVEDEFGKNNTVIITEQNITHTGGTLEGSSKAIY
jgi:hypothetical protein